MQEKNKLKILFVSAEVSPFAKTGGLADVAGSLPRSLAAMRNDIRIAMPRYKTISAGMNYVADFPVKMGWRTETCIVRETATAHKSGDESLSLPVYFIDNYHYFYRDGIYGFQDDGDRFAFFCAAVLEMLPRIGFQPDIIHCNDWHTGPICMLLNEKYSRDPFYSSISTVFTIHNLQYQGLFPKDMLKLLDVGDEVFVPDKVEFYGSFNFMKAGLVYADIISTVSETYAREIQTEEYGEKLEGLLAKRREDVYGVVNGIDYDEFNPQSDARIFKNYSAETFMKKKENKYVLQREMNLPQRDVPVLGLVSRLTGQKGLNLIVDIADELFIRDIQFVLLGTGDEDYERIFKNLRIKYPDKMGVYIGFNAGLAQRIYAGSDIFLMPSRFEPCGLGQIISLRYGTIPLVRATGGLAETITDIGRDAERGNGFSFTDFSPKELLTTIDRALEIYNKNPDLWNNLVKRALGQDFSWKKSADKYMELYGLALNKKRA
ncbi:MAG: glycogen synthase GlgA [Clostridiales bacterium]|jgi:starch synthase|nr:glycogen synthase GlgA [Eubacteriales bacterium]MDH7565276.1 glycogen synthase GlgA [Clostridiales bacterium]